MATVDEAEGARTPLGASLKGGLDVLSYSQTIVFKLYTRVVLPIDGFVFWVDAALVKSASAAPPPLGFTVMGSMHNTHEQLQQADENYNSERVIFTAQEQVRNFNEIGPDYLYIGAFDGGRFAFSSRGTFYQQANLWHYLGSNINSVMLTQIIDDASQVPALLERRIVSNSLPAWLALNSYAPDAYMIPMPSPQFKLYPSFLAPSNVKPPYGTIDIDPNYTVAQQQIAYIDGTMSRFQLAQDRVVVSLWGCDNDLASAWLDNVVQYTLDVGDFGLVNMPVIQDEKRLGVEFLAIAQKKRIVFEVSYNQYAMRNVARQLILSAFMAIYAGDNPIPVLPIVPIPIP